MRVATRELLQIRKAIVRVSTGRYDVHFKASDELMVLYWIARELLELNFRLTEILYHVFFLKRARSAWLGTWRLVVV